MSELWGTVYEVYLCILHYPTILCRCMVCYLEGLLHTMSAWKEVREVLKRVRTSINTHSG